ncbi:hypothetical protein LEP1GSC039_3574 [Leptospira santarosai str. 2000027870]|nr:hypothetical protein LEP1GSC039_3574 [Leptospira santarosai str. 2000027870]
MKNFYDILSKELVKGGLDSTLTKRKRRYGDKISSKRQAPSSILGSSKTKKNRLFTGQV